MTEYASAVTKDGKNRALMLLFGGAGDSIGYMGLSTSAVDPTEVSTEFPQGTELSGGNYSRQALTSVKPEDEGVGVDKQVTSEATFDTTVVTASKTVRQIGLFDSANGGTCFCICRIPDTVKDSSKTIKFTITNSVA